MTLNALSCVIRLRTPRSITVADEFLSLWITGYSDLFTRVVDYNLWLARSSMNIAQTGNLFKTGCCKDNVAIRTSKSRRHCARAVAWILRKNFVKILVSIPG